MPISLLIRHLGGSCGSASFLAEFLRKPGRPSKLSLTLPGQSVSGLVRGAVRHAGCCAMGMVIFPIKVYSRTADSSEMHTCGGSANGGSGGWIPQDRRPEHTRGWAFAIQGMGCPLTSLPSRLAPIPGLPTHRTLSPYNSPKLLQKAAGLGDLSTDIPPFPSLNCRIRKAASPTRPPNHFPV